MVLLAMALLILLTNVIAFQYGYGAVRTAVDEASRLGARLDGTIEQCEDHAEQVLRGRGGLLRGTMGDDIEFDCTVDGAAMVATATGQFEWWFGGAPSINLSIEGRSVIEPPVEAVP
ncbi:MAG: hypothetical protein HKN91_02345 [Acidimicrobiia bacterium]|nr:hypothetical protein [Acidimicrobiia bacterium]